MKRLSLAAALLLASTALATLPAQADTFVTLGTFNGNPVQWNTTNSGSLSLENIVPGGNQPQNIQCIICGENQPQQTLGYNDFKNQGSTSSISAFSTAEHAAQGQNVTLANDVLGIGYTVGELGAFLLTSQNFTIGVDINDSNQPQTLESFWFLNLTTHTVLASFTGGTAGNVPDINNGTGFPDYTITGFSLDRSDISAGDTILFLARMSGMNDGPDSFFFQPTAVAVPGPIVGAGIPGLIAACGGMFGLNFWRRRRHGSTLPA